MPNQQDDSWGEKARVTNGEAAVMLAMMVNAEPDEIRGWTVFVHVHPNDGSAHQTRVAANIDGPDIPKLIKEGLFGG